jgi:hypothetical protein
MADVRIRVFKNGEQEPETTVTIPGSVLDIASKLIPRRASAALENQGINLDELVEISRSTEARGVLVEVEEHKKGERIVVSLE